MLTRADLHQQFETLNPKVKYKYVSGATRRSRVHVGPLAYGPQVIGSIHRRDQKAVFGFEKECKGREDGLLLQWAWSAEANPVRRDLGLQQE